MPLDINTIRAYKGGDPEKVRESQRRRFADVALVDKVIAEDEEWRRLVALADDKRGEKNAKQKEITALKKAKAEVPPAMLAELKALDKKRADVECLVEPQLAVVKRLFNSIGNLVAADGGELERTVKVRSRVLSVAALPDGVHFVVALFKGEVKLYHVDGTLVHTFEGQEPGPGIGDVNAGHNSSVKALDVTRDGQHIISGGIDRTVKVWSVATKSLVSTCAGHTSHVYAVAAMPDGQRILSGSRDCTVRVWLLDGTLKKTFSELHPHHSVSALVALPDNQHALSGFHDKTVVKLFNVNDGAVLRTFTHHTGPVNCLALLPDGLRFVSGSCDGTACIAYHGLAPQ